MSRLRAKLIEDYAEHYARSNVDINPRAAQPKTLAMMERTFGPALARVPAGGRVLDVGCGTGFLLYWLLRRGGVSAVGVDASPSQVEVLKRHLPEVEVHCTDAVGFMRSHAGQFHAVFCTDVLEHIPDETLLEFVEAAREALVPGGVFVCRVPNATHLAAAHLRYIDLTHERSFTSQSMMQLLTAAGLTDCRTLPLRMGHFTGRLRMAVERLLHRAVFLACGDSVDRQYTAMLIASGVRPG